MGITTMNKMKMFLLVLLVGVFAGCGGHSLGKSFQIESMSTPLAEKG